MISSAQYDRFEARLAEPDDVAVAAAAVGAVGAAAHPIREQKRACEGGGTNHTRGLICKREFFGSVIRTGCSAITEPFWGFALDPLA